MQRRPVNLMSISLSAFFLAWVVKPQILASEQFVPEVKKLEAPETIDLGQTSQITLHFDNQKDTIVTEVCFIWNMSNRGCFPPDDQRGEASVDLTPEKTGKFELIGYLEYRHNGSVQQTNRLSKIVTVEK